MMERHEIEKAVRKSINTAFHGNLNEGGPYSMLENGTLHGCWFDWGRERIDGQSFSEGVVCSLFPFSMGCVLNTDYCHVGHQSIIYHLLTFAVILDTFHLISAIGVYHPGNTHG